MNVLFCHDSPIFKDSNSNYYSKSFTDEMFQRYFSIADELTVLTRQEYKENIENKMSKITISPINFTVI